MLNIEQSAETNKLMRNIFVRVRYFLAVMFVILRYQIIIIQRVLAGAWCWAAVTIAAVLDECALKSAAVT